MDKNKKIFIGILVIIILSFSWWIWTHIFIEKPLSTCGPKEVNKFNDVSFCNKSCQTAADCKFTCACGVINNGETCHDQGTVYNCVDREVGCENNICVAGKEKPKDETADWNTYSNLGVEFIFKYPRDWAIKEEYQYKSAACQADPKCEGVHYIFLNKISDSRPANLGEKEKFGIAIDMPQCTGVKRDDLPRNNWICVFDENSEVLGIYEKIKNSFQLIEDTTADWKTYRNGEHGFEFKYPEDWILEEDRTPPSWYIFWVEIKSSENVGCTCGGPSVPDEGKMVTITIKNNESKTLQDLKLEKDTIGCFTQTESINNNQALYYKNCPGCCAGYPGFEFIKGDYIFNFYSTYFPPTSTNSFDKLFEDIIKTLSFF
jgi:hypothetical protein